MAQWHDWCPDLMKWKGVFLPVSTYLLVEPISALLTHAEPGLGQILDPFELREDELAGPTGVEHLRMAGNRRHGYRRLPVRRRHVAHTGRRLRIVVLSGNRKQDLWPGRHLSHSRWVRHVCGRFCCLEVRAKYLSETCVLWYLTRDSEYGDFPRSILPQSSGIRRESQGGIVRYSRRINTRGTHCSFGCI